MLSHSLQSRWEGMIEDGIGSSMESHHHPEDLQMINGIGYPIIILQLRNLEVLRKWLLYLSWY